MEIITLDDSDNPVADATNSSGPVQIEQITTITPGAGSNYDQLEVTGNVRLQANAGVSPGEDDIFGDIYVYTA